MIATEFDGTLGSLVGFYQTEPYSTFHKLRYQSRLNSIRVSRIIINERGTVRLEDIKARDILGWYEEWTKRGVSMAHSLMGKIRTVINFGADFLETDKDKETCERVAAILHRRKFKLPARREEVILLDQVIAVRRMLHAMGWHSVARTCAFQFELMLRQKDCIGEWIPKGEPGESDVVRGDFKWMCGIRWSEIDSQLVIHHTTSKRGKDIHVDLKQAPMVLEELLALAPGLLNEDGAVNRHLLPASGPVIRSEATGYPFEAVQFRTVWRKAARLAGVPDTVKSMDHRAGAITEATGAGASLEHVRHAATHSNITTTQGYSRGAIEKTAEVQRIRNESRSKKLAAAE